MQLEARAAAFLARVSGPVAVAVSGGGDSLAALQLLWEAAPSRIKAVTVDHKLRPEAADEALWVGAFCAARQIPHDILTWQHGGEVAGNVSRAAREARYALLQAWAEGQGIAHLVVAHSREDVAESFLISLSRVGGLEGLAQMRSSWEAGRVTFYRPFLEAGRAELRAALTARGLSWVEDPSNQDPSYARVRMRALLPALEAAGVGAAQIARSSAHLGAAAEALDWVLAREFGAAGTPAGEAILKLEAYRALPQALRHRLLVGLCAWIGGGYGPRGPELMRLDGALCAGPTRRVLGGVLVSAGEKSLRAAREFAALKGLCAAGFFDHRWQITQTGQGEVAALGPLGLAQIPNWRKSGISHAAAIATPALWCEDRLIAAPIFEFGTGLEASLRADLGKSLLSH